MAYDDLRIGMEVYIKENLKNGKIYGCTVFTNLMHTGKVTIKNTRDNNYFTIIENKLPFLYSYEMVDWDKTEECTDKKIEQLEEIIATDKSDAIKPNHYKLEINGNECEVRDVMQAVMTEEEYDGFLYGNILKYILRAKKKNGIEDMKKAKLYLEWLIEGREE